MSRARVLADFIGGTSTISGTPTFTGTVTGAGGGGLVFIKRMVYSSVTSGFVTEDVFSADYTNYKVLIRWVNESSNDLRAQIRFLKTSDGSGFASSVYDTIVRGVSFAGVSTDLHYENFSVGLIGIYPDQNEELTTELTIWNPYKNDRHTSVTLTTTEGQGGTSGVSSYGGFLVRDNTSFSGFQLFADAAGTFSAEIAVYGLAES